MNYIENTQENSIIIENKKISFDIENQKVFITSFDIAEVFEKQHKHILRDIQALPDDDFRKSNFGLSNEVRKHGLFEKNSKYYKITKDGFCLLAMGFTGEKAYKWKILFIEAFNKIEQNLRSKMFELASLKKDYEYQMQKDSTKLNVIEQKINTLINHIQKQKNFQEKIQELQEERLDLKDQIINLQSEIIAKGTKIKIDHSKNTLTPSEEKMILSFLKEGKSVEEISKIMNKARTIIKKLSRYTNYSHLSYIKELKELKN
ncbi:Rha family transcriptional regulator [Helicobacter cappadocius]|uniref:Rha family transcriptional regulator n=1 Tax=Helicobacter cappadocius TaxID=3063998 RepID=A0AA90T4W2_9HELI|nr:MULTISPECIES: Rha family transcriptional regulator [unclassified Helicobacter]MDO7253081.1 Rha family transcriptional regulator [Helicobacter sp. faydin-H75]MDP2538793.1 Rha family transcriptional regulator [Helicobacter sp. faydin-H76]